MDPPRIAHDRAGRIDRRDLAELGPESFVIECQIESERGLLLMGTTIFSADALTAIDPAHFTSIDGEPLGRNLYEYEVPDHTWVWLWPRWFVDMSADVDDQGWCYSWRFRSKHWRGYNRFLRAFVRQRLWKRPRIKKSVYEDLMSRGYIKEIHSVDTSEPSVDTCVNTRDTGVDTAVKGADTCAKNATHVNTRKKWVADFMQKCRNDREKIQKVCDYISSDESHVQTVIEHKIEILGALMFDISREDFINKVKQMGVAIN